jgi:hypothetical protein
MLPRAERQKFFPSISLSVDRSSIDFASSFFSSRFSSSRPLSFLASDKGATKKQRSAANCIQPKICGNARNAGAYALPPTGQDCICKICRHATIIAYKEQYGNIVHEKCCSL